MILCCDIDGTLAESGFRVHPDILDELFRLSSNYTLAFSTGAELNKIQWQLCDLLNTLNEAYVFPASSSIAWHVSQGHYKRLYSYSLPTDDWLNIINAIEWVKMELGYDRLPAWGPRIAERGCQVTYSILGVNAPRKEKRAFDPDHTIKHNVAGKLRYVLNNKYDVRYSRTTSIDVSLPGMNKSYGVNWLLENVDDKVLYIGDRLNDRWGNDYPVTQTLATTINVDSPAETLELLKRL